MDWNLSSGVLDLPLRRKMLVLSALACTAIPYCQLPDLEHIDLHFLPISRQSSVKYSGSCEMLELSRCFCKSMNLQSTFRNSLSLWKWVIILNCASALCTQRNETREPEHATAYGSWWSPSCISMPGRIPSMESQLWLLTHCKCSSLAFSNVLFYLCLCNGSLTQAV